EIQFLKEAAKFVGDFKSLAKEADSSLAKHKILELDIERLLKAVVGQDIISVVQNAFVVDTSDLQTELERTKARFENCIIKKENEYAKLWNDWYKKCDECKYDKISYDKAYKDMQQKIERLQAQLGDHKGKCKDTSCVSDTHNLVFQKLENANVELEFQVFNYAKENAHLKATYKNLFDSISVTRAQTETKIASLQNEIQCNIYKNAKLRTQLFKKVSDQKENTQDSSKNTKFAKQPIVEILPKIGETNALSKPVTSNSVSKPHVSKGVNNAKGIAPGMFRISPDKVFMEAKKVPNTVSASSRTKPITVSQPSVITKKGMNSNSNAKFVGDFKSLANEADASLVKHKALELEIERLLKAVVSLDIMIIVQNESVVDTSDLQTKLKRTKERFKNCIIKKETEYAKLWNDWYKKCDECKYDKISYDKAYKDMKQKIDLLQARLGDLKGKSKDTSFVSDTQYPLSRKLENENLFKKVSDKKDNTRDTSENTKFAKQPIVENLPKIGKTNALSKPVTSNSVSTPQESKSVNNDKVIALGMFRINPSKTSREENKVPNIVSANARTKPITVSQPHVITKKDVNSDLNGLSSTGVDNTKIRRPQPRSNTKHDRVPLRLRVVEARIKKLK
nr:hypothetical protein [Tanacetum cinerariifolium]